MCVNRRHVSTNRLAAFRNCYSVCAFRFNLNKFQFIFVLRKCSLKCENGSSLDYANTNQSIKTVRRCSRDHYCYNLTVNCFHVIFPFTFIPCRREPFCHSFPVQSLAAKVFVLLLVSITYCFLYMHIYRGNVII